MATSDDVLIGFGPSANCTLDLCPLEWSVFGYLPNVPANATFIAIFGLLLIAHLIQGIRYKSWIYMSCVAAGCGTCEKHCVTGHASIRVLPRDLGLGGEGRNRAGRAT